MTWTADIAALEAHLMTDLDNDRDDSSDPEYRDESGYCEHGTYVGGCGIDWMCHWCELGISQAERITTLASQRRQAERERTQRRLKLRMALGMAGYKLTDLMPIAFIKQI